MSAAIEARGVEKRYGSLVAVADLSFEAEAGRDPRRPRPERRRQDDRDPRPDHDSRSHARELRGRRPPPHQAVRDPAAHRRPAGKRGLSGASDGRGVPALPRPPLRTEPFRCPRRRFLAPRGGRPGRPQPVSDLDVQPWHAPASRDRTRARERATGRVPRRADARARPGRAAADSRHGPANRRRARCDGAAVHASPGGGRGDMLARAHPQPRACGGAGHGLRGLAPAAAPRSGRLRVPPVYVESAVTARTRFPGVRTAPANGQPGLLRVTLAQTDGVAPRTMNAGVRAIVDARIPLLSYELEGARLSDAFLAMTEGVDGSRCASGRERSTPAWIVVTNRSFATSGSVGAVSC